MASRPDDSPPAEPGKPADAPGQPIHPDFDDSPPGGDPPPPPPTPPKK